MDVQRFVQFLRDTSQHLRVNSSTKAVEFMDGRALNQEDYRLIKQAATERFGSGVSIRLVRSWLSSGGLLPEYTPPPPISKYNIAGRADYEWWLGKPYALLYRKHGDSLTDRCPFCGKKHGHGKSPGHRVAHCARPSKMTLEAVSASDGTVLHLDNGYVIKEY